MEIITKEMFKTVDGKVFDCKSTAIRHEIGLAKNMSPEAMAAALSHLCQTGECSYCPFHNGTCILDECEPFDWEDELSDRFKF